jgi:hypothetical protein
MDFAMLLALALGGLAAAFAAPLLLSSDEDDAENDDLLVAEPGSAEGEHADSLLDVTEESGTGHTFEIAASAGEFIVENFDIETDCCIVTVQEIDVMVETGWDEDGTPLLRTGTAEGDFVVAFPGLDAVPATAVIYLVPEADVDGEEAVMLSLADILNRGADAAAVEGVTSDTMDGGEEHPPTIFDATFDDLGPLSPVLPSVGDVADDAADLLDALLPLGPGAGEIIDGLTDPLDDVLPLPPGDGDQGDLLPVPLIGVAPTAPGAGDEADT